MNKLILTATAAIIILAASCGQNAPKRQSNADGTEQATEQQAAITVQKITESDLPDDIGYQGDLIKACRYTDKTGESLVILTETEVLAWEDEGDYISTKGLYAYRFLKVNEQWEEVWRVYDMECECINYPVVEFVKKAFSITDLDKDGVAEIWLMYIKSCHGDVSPNNMYLRMYAGEEVYTMTGETLLVFSDEYSVGGEYVMDDKFLNKNTPSAFVDYAKDLWEKHIQGK